MANFVSKSDFSEQMAVYGGDISDKLKSPKKTKGTGSEQRKLSVPTDSASGTFAKTAGCTKKNLGKDFKSNLHNQKVKELKYLQLENLIDADKKLIERDAAKTLKKKLDIINILPQAKEDLKRILKDKQRITKLVKKLTEWLSFNNDKTLEIFNVFRNLGQNNCLTYPQFIGTMINFEAPFKMLSLCVLVIHLSSQKSGLIAEEDIKKLLSREPAECDICGFGKKEQVQTRTGPFGIRQMSFQILKKVVPVEIEKPSNFTESFLKTKKTNGLHTSPSRKNVHFKNVLIKLQAREKSTNKPSWKKIARKKSPEFANVTEKTIRTRDMLIDWRQNVRKTEQSTEAEELTKRTSRLIEKHSTHSREGKTKRAWPMPVLSKENNTKNDTPLSMKKRDSSRDDECLGKGKKKIFEIFTRIKANANEENTREAKPSRFKNVSTFVSKGLKTDESPCPRIATIADTMTKKIGKKRKAPSFKSHKLSFLDIPNVDEDILRAFTRQLPKELFVLIHLRSIIYDEIFSCPAHFSLLLPDYNTLTYVADCIKNANDISKANMYISPCQLSFRQTLLPLDKTLKQCGYRGYCKSHPLKITLYYDFVMIYDFDFN